MRFSFFLFFVCFAFFVLSQGSLFRPLAMSFHASMASSSVICFFRRLALVWKFKNSLSVIKSMSLMRRTAVPAEEDSCTSSKSHMSSTPRFAWSELRRLWMFANTISRCLSASSLFKLFHQAWNRSPRLVAALSRPRKVEWHNKCLQTAGFLLVALAISIPCSRRSCDSSSICSLHVSQTAAKCAISIFTSAMAASGWQGVSAGMAVASTRDLLLE